MGKMNDMTSISYTMNSAHSERRRVVSKPVLSLVEGSKHAQDKLRSKGEVEACEELAASPFDFPFDKLRVRSGRTGVLSTADEEVYESFEVRFRARNPQTTTTGFTLLEVVITLTLLGILLAIVTLQLPPLLSQAALRGATRQMVANLQYVRMKAVSQNRRLRVTFRPVTEDYIVDKDEEGVWQRQLLASHSTEAVADATVALPRGIRITAVNSGGDVIFLPRGAVDGGISITLGTLSGTETRRVVVNLAGRVRVE